MFKDLKLKSTKHSKRTLENLIGALEKGNLEDVKAIPVKSLDLLENLINGRIRKTTLQKFYRESDDFVSKYWIIEAIRLYTFYQYLTNQAAMSINSTLKQVFNNR